MILADFRQFIFDKLDAKGLGKQDVYLKRLNDEFNILKSQEEDYKTSVSDYFMGIAEQTNKTGKIKNSNNMLLSYLLDITDEDPIKDKKELIKTKSAEFPDIDMDFEDAKRDLVKEYVVEKYGRSNVASIAAFGKMQAKSVIKDIARIKNIPHEEVNEVTKKMSHKDTLEESYDSKDEVKKFFDKYAHMELFELCKKLQGNIRHISQHAAGVVIAPSDITNFCGLEKAKDSIITCFEEAGGSKELSKLGLVKMDFLGLNTLTVIHEAVDNVKKNHGIDVDIRNINYYDKALMDDFAKSHTVGIFQFERDWVRMMLRRMNGIEFSDICTLNALNRPGPIEMGEKLWKTKTGVIPSSYLHPLLKPILEPTYGVTCLVGDSTIKILNGNKKIRDVEVGDMALTYDGTYQRVLNKISNGKRCTVKIRVSNGEVLQCTGDHLVLTSNGWKKACYLEHGDLIKSFWMSEENIEIGDDSDWLVGLALADGDITSTPPVISCSSKEFAEKVKIIADKAYNLNCHIYFHTRCWYVSCRGKNVSHNLKSKNFKYNLFTKRLRDMELFGKDCYTKSWPSEFSLSMLAGFVEGDGCLENQLIRLKNRNLAYGVYEAFQSFKIQSNYFLDDKDKKNKVNSVGFKDIKRILPFRIKKYTSKLDNVTSVYVPKNDLLFISEKLKKNQMFMRSNRRFISKNIVDESGSTCIHGNWSMVLSRHVSSERDVFDLSIENNHNFVTGGLVVHNCYQEQGMEIARVLSGFSADEADTFRKAMSSGKADLAKGINPFEKHEKRFIDGCRKNGINQMIPVNRTIVTDKDIPATAKDVKVVGSEIGKDGVMTSKISCIVEVGDELFFQIKKFAEYGFNKSHAVGYSQIAVQCMYLKHYYPLEFMASLLSNTPNATNVEEKENKFIDYFYEAKRMKIKVLPPNINTSSAKFTPTSDGIISGFGFIKELGDKAIEEIIKKRPFKNFTDFLQKISGKEINKSAMFALIHSGCFDELIDGSIDKKNLYKRYDLISQYVSMRKVKDANIPDHPTSIDAISAEADYCGDQIFNSILDLIDLEKINQKYSADDKMMSFSNVEKMSIGTVIRTFGIVESFFIKRNPTSNNAVGFLQIKNGSKRHKFMMWNKDIIMFDRDDRFKSLLKTKSVITFRTKRDRDYKEGKTFVTYLDGIENIL